MLRLYLCGNAALTMPTTDCDVN